MFRSRWSDRMDVVVHPAAQGSVVEESGRTREAEMRYNIAQDGEAVEIHLQDAGERGPQVLASLQECQEGRCSCPTDQYDRLASIEVGGGDGPEALLGLVARWNPER